MYQDWQCQLTGMTLDGWQIEPDEKGPQGPFIVATHGWLDNANSLLPLAKRIRNHSLLAFDWPGHGLSQHLPAAGNYHFVDWADVLLQVLEQLKQPVVLVGHSMGALVNAMVAAAFPEKVSHLVMIEGAGPLASEPEQAAAMLRKGLLSRKRSRKQTTTRYDDIHQAVAARHAVSTDLTPTLVELLIKRNIRASQDGVQWGYDPRVRAFSATRMTEPQVRAILRAIECPVQIIMAKSGYPEMKTMLASRRDCFRQLQVAELPGGHHVHMTQPKKVASLIEQFVADTIQTSD
ncbi:alpha/beta hydrolase [Neiella sp. HB171785]|uniref:Alpha/beta hydrolase n=1 Tax=Neiella litorisoli TaxID=2771431 RepID=A0A8J6QHK1_9GAMM|nr:alpha/beta hydrolase [Neiella litorisoli]MBD1388602.1 alpha/beta hydrolase [Neiella litorisoli]